MIDHFNHWLCHRLSRMGRGTAEVSGTQSPRIRVKPDASFTLRSSPGSAGRKTCPADPGLLSWHPAGRDVRTSTHPGSSCLAAIPSRPEHEPGADVAGVSKRRRCDRSQPLGSWASVVSAAKSARLKPQIPACRDVPMESPKRSGLSSVRCRLGRVATRRSRSSDSAQCGAVCRRHREPPEFRRPGERH